MFYGPSACAGRGKDKGEDKGEDPDNGRKSDMPCLTGPTVRSKGTGMTDSRSTLIHV